MLSFFPRDVLDKIWDLIESVSEGFPKLFCSKEFSEILIELWRPLTCFLGLVVQN